MHNRRHVVCGIVAAVAALASGSLSATAEPMPLAIKGYDPVAYFTKGAPARGLPDFEYEWDEYRYRFASAENRDLFKADPVRYAPQFANFCTMALGRGTVLEADPQYWLVSDGKLYLFTREAGPALFQQDPPRHRASAEENRRLIKR